MRPREAVHRFSLTGAQRLDAWHAFSHGFHYLWVSTSMELPGMEPFWMPRHDCLFQLCVYNGTVQCGEVSMLYAVDIVSKACTSMLIVI